ncbi:MAG TPA: hypothetical protein VKF40_11810 [Burkholderiales bacterium]|nr:hypothetical protein [Burkholderiales bacterium]
MIGAEEKRKLMERAGNDPTRPLRVVLKCAVCIGLLVTIAAGPWTFLSSGGPTAAKGSHVASKADAPRAEGKRVFDEGRYGAHQEPKGGVTKENDATPKRTAAE